MANNSQANVSVGKPKAGGAIFVAPAGTTLPTDATTALANAFVNLGYVSEDGLTDTMTTDTGEIKEWGGAVVLAPQTGSSEEFKFSLLETNQAALAQVYGASNITVGSGGIITITNNGAERAAMVYVFEIVMTGSRIKRVVVPNGKVTEIGEIAYKLGDPIKFDLTVAALPDATGNKKYEYIAEVI